MVKGFLHIEWANIVCWKVKREKDREKWEKYGFRPPILPSIDPSFRLSVHPSIHMSIYLPVCPSIHRLTSLPLFLNCCRFVFLLAFVLLKITISWAVNICRRHTTSTYFCSMFPCFPTCGAILCHKLSLITLVSTGALGTVTYQTDRPLPNHYPDIVTY